MPMSVFDTAAAASSLLARWVDTWVEYSHGALPQPEFHARLEELYVASAEWLAGAESEKENNR